MKLLDLIRMRRSARRYSQRPVPREMIDSCLEAARLAPSACNSQPWSFIVVDDPSLIAALAGKAFSGAFRMNSFVGTAPVLIVVITERSVRAARLGGLLRGVRYNLIDIGIACEHLVLQATELGLGTCWLGWFDGKAVKKVLGLPRNAHVDVMISMGYSDEPLPAERPRKPLDAVRSYRPV